MYKPVRDERFEYLSEAIEHIEQRQCQTCVARKEDDQEFPMCYMMESLFLLEKPIAEIDDNGNAGLKCKLYKMES